MPFLMLSAVTTTQEGRVEMDEEPAQIPHDRLKA